MVWKIFSSASSAQTSVDEKLEKLRALLSSPGQSSSSSDTLAAQVKELCGEIAGEHTRLQRSLDEEKRSVSVLVGKMKDLETELDDERKCRADAQKESRALSEELQVEQEMRQEVVAQYTQVQAEASALESQVLELGCNNLVQAEELDDVRHEISCTKDALLEKEVSLAVAEEKVLKLVSGGPHKLQFDERKAFIPRLKYLADVLDLNYSRSCQLLSSRPFAAETEAAAKTVESETLEDRLPVVDPNKHTASVKALDPAGGCGLPSLELLNTELGKQGDSAPEFFAAIGGAELHQALGEILEKYSGPHREEDDYLRDAVRKYVNEVIRELYQNSQQAALDMQQRLQLEADLTKEIQMSSQELTKEFLEDRNEQESKRNKKVEALMDFFLEKLRAVTGHQHEQVLEQKSEDFKAQNAEALQRYEALATRHRGHSTEQRERAGRLQAYCRQKEDAFRRVRASSNWSRLACGVRVEEEAAIVKAHLDIILDVMEDAREMTVLKDQAQRELEQGSALAGQAREEQERLAQQHEDLAAHYGECRVLLSDFEAFVRRGYSGLRAKAEADAAALARDLPRDCLKVAALSRAYEEELDRQLSMTHAVMAETTADRQSYERQLRALEKKRSRGGNEFEHLKAQWDTTNTELKGLSEDLDALGHQKAKGLEASEAYAEDFKKAGVVCDLEPADFQGDVWAGSFLYNDRQSTSFQPPPRMLLYGSTEAPFDAATVQSYEVVGQSEAASYAGGAGASPQPKGSAAASSGAQGEGLGAKPAEAAGSGHAEQEDSPAAWEGEEEVPIHFFK